MAVLADQGPDIAGKGFWIALIIIAACGLALYFGGKRD
jgi:type IV secretory pathway VirB2 component (pilin)